MTTAAIVASVVSVGAQTTSYFEQKKAGRRAERAQEKANRMSSAQAQAENARNRRRAIAQARLAQAQNQASQGSEVQSSSALSGVQSGLSTQLGANFGAQKQRIGTQLGIQGQQQRAATAIRKGNERAGMWNLVGGIAGMGAQLAMADLGKDTTTDTDAGSPPENAYTGNQFKTWVNNQ